jgi:hypothetical protein
VGFEVASNGGKFEPNNLVSVQSLAKRDPLGGVVKGD